MACADGEKQAARRRREFSVGAGGGPAVSHCDQGQWGYAEAQPAQQSAGETRKVQPNSGVMVARLAPRRMAAKKTFVSVSLELLLNSGV